MTVNKAILVGNLGQDPELRTTGGGIAVSNLSLATSDRRKDRDGNYQDVTEWHRIVCFGKTAENVAKFCRKGKQLYVEGRIQTRKWQDKDGRDRWSTEIAGDVVRFLGGRGDGAGGGDTGQGYSGGSSSSSSSSSSSGKQQADQPYQSDDVPF